MKESVPSKSLLDKLFSPNGSMVEYTVTWYKFKDRLPKTGHFYITNWVSTWPSFMNSEREIKIFGIANPDYAWANIPDVETPIEPKVRHECCRDTLRCYENKHGLYLEYNPLNEPGIVTWTKIKACPICGYAPIS